MPCRGRIRVLYEMGDDNKDVIDTGGLEPLVSAALKPPMGKPLSLFRSS